MHPSAQRVQTALEAAGYQGKVVELEASTRTSEEAAAAAGCLLGQIAKSLIFQLEPENQPILILVSGVNRVHEKHFGRFLGGKLVRPDADYVRDVTGFAIGGIPPIGHKSPLKTYIDEDLMEYETVWGAAGTHNAVFPITPQQLQQISNAEIVNVK
jgi:prolyl-tRNA editing enzyme YbaK/EbsC (Cys-tRNA(Pro) deacylase)